MKTHSCSVRFSWVHLEVIVALAVCALWCAPMARADIVEMYDGRRFEGKIFEESPTTVRIDTVVAGIRVKIGVPRRQVKSLQKLPLAEGFFDLKPKAAERVSDPKKFAANSALFLEVPIVGRFGAQVMPTGVRNALAYAQRHKIPNVVFYIDSQGGDRMAARQIYETIGRYPDLKYHALVRDSVGVSMAVTVFCETLFMLPGANLGGVVLEPQDEEQIQGDPALERAQVAFEVGQGAEKRGWPAPLVRAMIDPAETVFAWLDENGKIATAPRPPADIPRDKIIISDSPNSVLTLNRAQALALGARSYNGSTEGLGAELGIDNWTRESDYGMTAMMTAAKAKQRSTTAVAKKQELAISRLIQRRDAVKKYIDRCLTLAHAWDPEQNAYSDFSQNEQKWERYWGGPIEATISRSRWRELTDFTIDALVKAHKGIQQMKVLEDKAVDSGLEPLYEEGILEKYQDDIEIKVTLLQFWRERKTRSG